MYRNNIIKVAQIRKMLKTPMSQKKNNLKNFNLYTQFCCRELYKID